MSYAPTEWKTGDVISAERLNKAEQGIKDAHDNADDCVTKDSLDNAGITDRTYVVALNGEFTVTTVASQDYNFPYARANVTGRFNKENQYRVTVNEVEYILSTRLWYIATPSEFKVYEYLGNLGLYISDISGVPGGTDDVPFIIISDIDSHSSIDVLTNSAGTYTILVEKIVDTQTKIPNDLIYGDNYAPIEKNNNSGTYNGFSIGVNELTNKRGTIAIGYGNKITSNFSTAIGIANEVSGGSSVVLGNRSQATGLNSYAEGYQNIASGDYSHAEGVTSTASGLYSHAETGGNTASGDSSHAEGYQSIASGNNSHAEGYKTQAVGSSSHSSGMSTKANAVASFAQGISSIANKVCQSVFGKNNVIDESEDSSGKYSFIIGNGTSSSARSNAYALDWTGNGHFQGDVYVGCNNDSTGGVKLARIPDPPNTDGTYILQASVLSGVITYSWINGT